MKSLRREGADIVIADPAWTGGISEVKKISSLTDIYGLPFAPHNSYFDRFGFVW